MCFPCRSEKVLVVLLVASATVCCLTNLLVYLILTMSTRSSYNRGKRVKLVLRYQLMKNQALTGILTTAIVIYPLKVNSYSKNPWPASYASENYFWRLCLFFWVLAFGIFWDPLEPFETRWDAIESFGNHWDPLGLFGILLNSLGSFRIL